MTALFLCVGVNYTVNADVSINKEVIYVAKGKTAKLRITGTTKKASWTSSNKEIATVTSKGVVKGIEKGTVIITAKVGTKTYKCKVYVQIPKLSAQKVTVTQGKKYQLKVTGTTRKVEWWSLDTDIATISDKGIITGKKPGSTEIYATVLGVEFFCKVTVKKGYSSPTPTPAPTKVPTPSKLTTWDYYLKLKDTIVKIGEKNSVGNPLIGKTVDLDSMTATYAIVFEKSKSTFQFIFIPGNPSAEEAMTIDINKTSINKGVVKAKFYHVENDYVAYTSQASIVMKSFTGKNGTFKVTEAYGYAGVPRSLMNELPRIYLQMAFSLWDNCLAENTTISFKNLGFVKYRR